MAPLLPKRTTREFWASRGVTFTNQEWRKIRRRGRWLEIKIRLADAWDGLKGDR